MKLYFYRRGILPPWVDPSDNRIQLALVTVLLVTAFYFLFIDDMTIFLFQMS